MAEPIPLFASLRLRLFIGAAVIALVAVFAAILAAYGTAATARMLERSAAAQSRIDLLSALSARVSDYAVIAVETAAPGVPSDARQARLSGQAARVEDAFANIDKALAQAVAEVEDEGEVEQMRRATRSLGVARMRAQFQALTRSVAQADGGPSLRAHLDGFATQFSPLLNDAVIEEQRERDAARHTVAELRDRMIWRALAAGLVAAFLTAVFYLALVRPVVAKLGRVREAAAGIGAGDFDVALPTGGQSELDWLMHEINRTADSLRGRQDEVDADRARLNEIIAERTAKLEEANQRLAKIDTERRRFFADVGHELRTPLTVILAESELGMGDKIASETAAESLSVIHARARRLNRRIDDLLRVARSETGQIDLQSGHFDLADAATEAVADIEPLARRREICLVMNLAPSPAAGDADWCRQVLSGVIENALKKSASGSIVEIACMQEGNRAVVTVIDEGEGLPPDEAEKVFGRFARGSREVSGSGFGVGLALGRWVVERQSGTIELDSPAPRPPRGGATGRPGVQVTISLPASPEGEEDDHG